MNRRLSILNQGFTLIELIIVIVVTGILVAVVGPLIGGKYQAVTDAQQRATWVQQAEYALFHIRQDLQRSVPNSVRASEPDAAGDNQVVEFLGLSMGQEPPVARYRDRQHPSLDRLRLTNEDAFDVFETTSLSAAGLAVSVGGTSVSQIYGDWNNQSSSTNGVIAEINTVTNRAGTVCDDGDCTQNPVALVDLDTTGGNHTFPDHSPHFRAYFTDGPVAYACTAGRLIRYSGYTSLANTALSGRVGAATASRVVDSVVDCSFSWQAGSAYRPPTVTIRLALGAGGESVQLVETIPLRNGL